MRSPRLPNAVLAATLLAGLLVVLGGPSCGNSIAQLDPPRIDELTVEATNVSPGLTIALNVDAAGAGTLSYAWVASSADDGPVGEFSDSEAAATAWTAPHENGVVLLTVTVSDARGGATSRGVPVVVGPLVDADSDGYAVVEGDCDDTDATVYPGAAEGTDGIDNDCDGAIDEGSDDTDDDGDGFTDFQGDCDDGDPDVHPGATELVDGVDQDCNDLIDDRTEVFDDDGDGFSEEEGDCDDANAAIGPASNELLDSVDNDCDGVIDENTLGYDDDGDGFTELQGDCDDGNSASYPGAHELADGRDNDCDGTIDDGSLVSDDDGDGYTGLTGDCDDANPYTYPGAPEYADGRDNDCDGQIDEGVNSFDNDGDGFSEADGDCNDSNPSIYPGATELDDGIDNDCDGTGYTSAPTAVAVLTSDAISCAPVHVSAVNSFDPDGDTLDFSWFFTIKPPLSALADDDIDERFAMDASFVPDTAGYFAVAVQVNDGTYTSAPTSVGVTVVGREGNSPPDAAITGGDQIASGQSTCEMDPYAGLVCQPCQVELTLDAFASSDPDGDPLRFEWDADHVSGEGNAAGIVDNGDGTATLGFSMSAPPSGGQTSGVYNVEVTATDCNGAQDISSITLLYSCQG